MFSQIDHVVVMPQVVRHGVAATVSALAKAAELDLCLMVGSRGIISAPYSAPPLINSVEQAKGVSSRLKVI